MGKDSSHAIDISSRDGLQEALLMAGGERSLLRPGSLVSRLNFLDGLDACRRQEDRAGSVDPGAGGIAGGMDGLRTRLEAANRALFEAARAEIADGGDPQALRRWLQELVGEALPGHATAGLGFDVRDEIVCGVLGIGEPAETEVPVSDEMVAYQPTPVRHILDLITICRLQEDDVLIDLGSGLGQVPLLVSILNGCRAVGVEIEPAYVRSAREAAARLRLGRVEFVQADARVADLSAGTVFFLFTPFLGSMLDEMLARLRVEGLKRRIRVASLGPSTRFISEQDWLLAIWPVDVGRVSVFESRRSS